MGWPFVHGLNDVDEARIRQLLLVTLAAIQWRAEFLGCFEHEIPPPERSGVRRDGIIICFELKEDISQLQPATRLKIAS